MEEKAMREHELTINNKPARGVEIRMPNANLVMIIGSRGYLFCGYLNLETAEKLGDAAAVITGVKTIEDMLEAKVVKLTRAARTAGVTEGMTGREALAFLT